MKYYLKLTSLNPYMYQEIDQYKAIAGYIEYLTYAVSKDEDLAYVKTFSEWLKTEI